MGKISPGKNLNLSRNGGLFTTINDSFFDLLIN